MKKFRHELVEQGGELIIYDDFIACYEVDGIQYNRDTGEKTAVNNDNCLRVYKSSPEAFTLQIRAFKPINQSGTGKPRNMIAHIRVGVEELRRILSYAEANLK